MDIKAVVAIPASADIGECIYCGSKINLAREHIVPYGLGGPWTLQNGSCKECAEITSRFERDVLEKHLKEPRATLGLPTYHKKNRPKTIDLEVLRNGEKETVAFNAGQCPTLIIMPHFKVPAYLGKYKYKTGIMVVGSSLHGSSNTEEMLKTKIADGISVTQSMAPVSFARMLAKIAYGMAILKFGIHAFKETFILPCVLGQKEDVGNWVGYTDEPANIPDVENLLHKVEIVSSDSIVSAHIRLFANYKTPVYLVFIGELK